MSILFKCQAANNTMNECFKKNGTIAMLDEKRLQGINIKRSRQQAKREQKLQQQQQEQQQQA